MYLNVMLIVKSFLSDILEYKKLIRYKLIFNVKLVK